MPGKRARSIQTLKYILLDLLAAATAWILFFVYRKYYIEAQTGDNQILLDNNLYIGLLIIPVFWFAIYTMAGAYRNVYRKSRIGEVGLMLLLSIIGVIILFFALLLDDDVDSYRRYYHSFFILFLLHFGITALFRIILTSITANRIHSRKLGFSTVIVGSNGKAIKIFKQLEGQQRSSGNKIIGFVSVNPASSHAFSEYRPCLGDYTQLHDIIREHCIEEVILAIEDNEHKRIVDIITELYETDVIVKIIPDMRDIMLGTVKMTAIFGAPIIEISRHLMPTWQKAIKRMLDIVVSFIAVLILLPVYIIVGVGVKISSRGSMLYSHQRIGLHGKPFLMHKFRSMYVDAEKHGPALSHKNDPRITPFGRMLRKWRLDELPQFFTVLKGDMSLVGYRPERQYFIEQISKQVPQYRMLLKIKPGITSWGQVKFGYAENVEEMVERLQYDLLYIENMSLAVDFKILIYTVLIIVQGRGK